jgi:hypothetical protein
LAKHSGNCGRSIRIQEKEYQNKSENEDCNESISFLRNAKYSKILAKYYAKKIPQIFKHD